MNKKIIVLSVVLVIFLVGCGYDNPKEQMSPQVEQKTPVKQKNDGVEEKMVGNDRDEHGCIGSAGYVWSEEKNKCVRPWEE
jgi:hypothetical protein